MNQDDNDAGLAYQQQLEHQQFIKMLEANEKLKQQFNAIFNNPIGQIEKMQENLKGELK